MELFERADGVGEEAVVGDREQRAGDRALVACRLGARGNGAGVRVVGLAEARPRAVPEVERETQAQRLPRLGLKRAVLRRGEVRRLRVKRGEQRGLARRQRLLAQALDGHPSKFSPDAARAALVAAPALRRSTDPGAVDEQVSSTG